MTDTSFSTNALPDPTSAPALFEGVLTRRVLAYLVDLVFIGLVAMALGMVTLVVGVLTLGLGWLMFFILGPAAILLYYTLTLGSSKRATIGMRMMDIVLVPANGQRLDRSVAFIHALIFYVTFWISWPISLLFVMFTPRRQMIHDLLTGTLVLRRSALPVRA